MPHKSTKPAGTDIRAFFGPGQSAQSSSSSRSKTSSGQVSSSKSAAPSSGTKHEVIEIDSDEELSAHKKIGQKKPSPMPKSKSQPSSKTDSDTRQPSKSTGKSFKRKKNTVLLSSDDEDETPPPKKKTAVATSSSVNPRPRPSTIKDDSDFDPMDVDDRDFPPTNSVKSTSKKTATPKVDKSDSKVKQSQDKTQDVAQGAKKSNWAAKLARGGPSAPGSKEVPDGEPDCLAGLSFVFTGELSSFSREEATDIAKRFGGRVVGQPSSKTNYVVLGEDAGPAKLRAIEKHGLKTLDEDAFLNLIATRKGPGVNGKGLDEKTRKKMEKEQEAIKSAAQEMDKREREAAKQVRTSEGHTNAKSTDPSAQLWTTRYAPQSLKEICGNKAQVEKLEQWLKDWSQSLKANFKKPGKNGMNMYRAVLISGSPGIGKTTSAHLCAKLAGFTPIELNASDTRSKKLVENGMNINNTSLDGYITGRSANHISGVTLTDRTCLIMDEVDGMSAGDRGGVGALNALIKKTKIPIICIANDRNAQKLKPLMGTTFNLTFQKPQATTIRSRILSIVYKEKMKIPANVVDQLISGAQSDIRQVLNMLSTWKLSNDSMSFDESKDLTKMNEKYAILSPFDITTKMLGPYLFSKTSRETLGQKMDYYFQDHSFIPLFIQENYLKSQPAKIRDLDGPEKILTQLKLMDEAASSISDADLVDNMIHGPEQHWSLMPLHAVCSTVRPASCVYGAGAHYGGPNSLSFPQWLGQNSKQNKLSRQLGDVQTHIRLKVSADKPEIRQSYIPALHPYIVQPLVDEGTSAIADVIQTMDEYYLSREDWDTIVELGVDSRKDDLILKKIPTAVKTSFTRKYNSSDHPIPFHKAQDLGKAPKKLAAEAVPDLEEAFDLDEVVEEASDDERNEKDTDIDNDKLIKAPKKKGIVKAASAKTANAKATKGKK
ncbi:purine nucleotide binding protein [Dendrothele bispora CBS 962.96]|uniref:Replication factor C subunit 1 n=1 Tax=Dendrothele bispora (strain CBS 962.96) TaxID=1314807 RepID=A0A4S8MAD3_DENBC|nr:purine nucleotide binding protein [Dendrothele bispora CBS 962.96]THV01720.1 purine nucleotide binding protein [Dendrothele bispora CBS 962.96]